MRLLEASPTITKGSIQAAIIIVIAALAFIISRQVNHAAAVTGSSAPKVQKVQSANLDVSASTQSQTDPAGDQSGQAGRSNFSSTNVTINGQRIQPDKNGNIDTTVVSDNGSTATVKVNNQSGQASNSYQSSVKINIDSSTTTSTSTGGGL